MVTAGEIMSTKVVWILPKSPVLDALRLFTQHQISGIPVVNDDMELVGIITEKDVLKLLMAFDPEKKYVEDYMSHQVLSFKETDSVIDICQFFIKNVVRRVPILNEDNKLVGIVSRRDIIAEIQRIKSI